MPIRPGDYLNLTIESMNHDGYGVSHTETGKAVWVLNALPGEQVMAQVMKRKRGKLIAEATEVLKASSERVEPRDPGYLSGGSWQMMSFSAEKGYKQQTLKKLFKAFDMPSIRLISDDREYGYRNKLEFSFYGDRDTGRLDLAFSRRGTKRGKIPVEGTYLAPEVMNESARDLRDTLNNRKISRDQVKFLQVRYSYHTDTVTLYLFVKDTSVDWNWIQDLISDKIVGIEVIYSEPKSPAAVMTEVLHEFGTTEVVESLLSMKFFYPGHGFFQVNPPLFEQCLSDIRAYVGSVSDTQTRLVDLYAGVGVIGLACARSVGQVVGVELFEESREYALRNARENGVTNFEFIEGAAESCAKEVLVGADVVLLDPPRAGVHPKIIKAIREFQPEDIIYLSCNPKTQAMDLEALSDLYDITLAKGYNFYPRTPHMEHLMCLKRKRD